MDLTMLKNYSNEVKNNVNKETCKFYYKNINDNVHTILDACKIYFDSEVIILSNLDCINKMPDRVYINKWIWIVVKDKKEDLHELIKKNDKFNKICKPT